MELELLILETQRDFNYLFYGIDNEYMTESSGDGSNFIDTIISKVKEIIQKIKEKIQSFFAEKSTKETINQVQEKAKKNPELLKKKVDVIDYDKLNKLNMEMQAELSRGNGNLKEKMEKYRKQRNAVIAAGAVTTVTLGTLLAIITKKKNDKISELNGQLNKTTKNLNSLKSRHDKLNGNIRSLQEENQDLKDKLLVKNQPTVKRKLQAKGKVVKRKFDENTSKMSDSIELVKQEASANAEVLKNVSNDIMHQTMDAFKACKSNSNSIIDKTKAVASSAINVKDTVKDLATGKTKENINTSNKQEIAKKIKTLKEKRERARKMYNDHSQPRERRMKAKDYIDMSSNQYNTLVAKYNKLNK